MVAKRDGAPYQHCESWRTRVFHLPGGGGSVYRDLGIWSLYPRSQLGFCRFINDFYRSRKPRITTSVGIHHWFTVLLHTADQKCH